MMENETKLHLATGYRPIHPDKLESLRNLLAAAEKGEVTGFVFCAAGPNHTYWTSRTNSTRSDRVLLIGQLQLVMHDLIDDEEVALSRGE